MALPAQPGYFVQEFYDWYVPIALGRHNEAASDIALRKKPQAFTSELTLALQADSAAQSRVPDYIVGLDFDPFLSSQDPCQRYVTGQVVQKTSSSWVDLYSVCDGKKSSKVDVIAEVKQGQQGWMFVNFHYPPDDDLLKILKILANQRQKQPE